MARKQTPTKEEILARFMSKVFVPDDDGCWIWKGAVRARYGTLNVNNVASKAHRVSYDLFVGPIENKHVLHKCDQPLCVNPKHLFLGTIKENMHDRDRKGRQRNQHTGRLDTIQSSS